VREAIFNALEARGADFDKVLDAFAGSGALGIEALSRGDGNCDFIEHNTKAASVIRENLDRTGLTNRGRVHQFRVEQAPERLSEQYSLMFADPPYDDEAAINAIERIAESSLLGPKAMLVLEHSSRSIAPERLGNLRLDWNRRYGDTLVSMYGVAS
jgi:16S rRNA (guanine(966)-N(2))-methyltransferase RsmD